MTRKDFELIAAVICEARLQGPSSEPETDSADMMRIQIANEFARRLSTTNAAFNKQRFLGACDA
jgi:hypothetical protein